MFWKRRRHDKAPKPNRRDTWQSAAELMGGSFEAGKRPSGDAVVVEHGGWRLRLETYTVHTGEATVTYTRARVLFTGQGEPRLLIRKRNLLDPILQNLGFGGVIAGDRAFAKRFVVKGQPRARLRSLLTGGLTAALLADPLLRVTVKRASRKDRKALGPEARRLDVYTTGVVIDAKRLTGMVAVGRAGLDALASAGLAKRAD